MNYTLRSHKNDIRAEVCRTLLERSVLKYQLETIDDVPNQPSHLYNTQPVLIEHDSSSDTCFTLTGMNAIEIYLASKCGLCYTNDVKFFSRQMQVRENINEFVLAAQQFVQQLPDAGSDDSKSKQMAKDFQKLVESFVKHHEKLLWQNGAPGHYFGRMPTFVEVALVVSIESVRNIVPKPFRFALKAFDDERASGIQGVFKDVSLKSNTQPRVIAGKGKSKNVVFVPAGATSQNTIAADSLDSNQNPVFNCATESLAETSTDDPSVETVYPNIESPSPKEIKLATAPRNG
ncbi:hypothetical protein GGI07_005431, partial [Coemansia sp. Benny D115]